MVKCDKCDAEAVGKFVAAYSYMPSHPYLPGPRSAIGPFDFGRLDVIERPMCQYHLTMALELGDIEPKRVIEQERGG